jgi:hypothetical protein
MLGNTRRILTGFALAAGSTGCGESHTTRPLRFTDAAPASFAQVEHGTAVFNFNRTHFFGCAGETVRNVFSVTFSYTRVRLPTGEYVYRELWPRQDAVGTVTGLSSGHVWQRNNLPSPYVERSTGGGMTHFTSHVRFVSETGPTLIVREVFHMSRNASGELVVDEYKASCDVNDTLH